MLRPGTWHHYVFSLLSTEIGAVGLTAWLIGVLAPWLDPDDRAHAPLYLGFWLTMRAAARSGLITSPSKM